MTLQTERVSTEIVSAWQEIAQAYRERPLDAVPPETPEVIEEMVKLISTVYGDALKRLADN